jgi:hypothetical protein
MNGTVTPQRIVTPYTYKKTGPNTATFNIVRAQGAYPESQIKGTLTYTSATECEYVFETGTLITYNLKFKVYVIKW